MSLKTDAHGYDKSLSEIEREKNVDWNQEFGSWWCLKCDWQFISCECNRRKTPMEHQDELPHIFTDLDTWPHGTPPGGWDILFRFLAFDKIWQNESRIAALERNSQKERNSLKRQIPSPGAYSRYAPNKRPRPPERNQHQNGGSDLERRTVMETRPQEREDSQDRTLVTLTGRKKRGKDNLE